MKTAIIGVDGANWNTIDPLLHAGCLPTLKRLIVTVKKREPKWKSI